MNLYVSADMEGTAGVCSWKQCDPSDAHEYPVYRRYMSQEVRAAVDGAREAGIENVLINDSHWEMRNLLFDELPEDDRLHVISGTRKPFSMGQGLDAGFDAVFLTGYHAKAGDPATLAHTMSDTVVYRVSVNGTPCSEGLLFAALAGSYGVPVTLVTGDRTIVEELTRALPWAIGVPVKEAIGFSAVESLTPHAAQAAIREGARAAVEGLAKARPFTFAAPYELVLETVTVEQADFIELMPRFERVGGRAVRFLCEDYRSTMLAFIAATRLGSAANTVA
ncbi:MAG TPA: M55 family metallopeptidase [Verrucomicrobiae bacterium]|nr:M55 family metallopeptidase [Verrucomicrobiae bacterium]